MIALANGVSRSEDDGVRMNAWDLACEDGY
jgi:hypothetical protein